MATPFCIYEGYAPDTGGVAIARATQMLQGNFTRIINYASLECHQSALSSYLAGLAANGQQVYLGVHDKSWYWSGLNSTTVYPLLAADLGATSSTDYITKLIAAFDSNSAVAGYYIGDEVSSAHYTDFTTYGALVKTLTSKTRLCVMGGLNGDPTSSLNSVQSGVDMLGLDFYPFGDDGLPYSEQVTNWSALESVCKTNSKQLTVSLQAFSWQQYSPPQRCAPWPGCAPYVTLSQMQQQYNDTIAQLTNPAPSMIIYYSFFDTATWQQKYVTTPPCSGRNVAWANLNSITGGSYR